MAAAAAVGFPKTVKAKSVCVFKWLENESNSSLIFSSVPPSCHVTLRTTPCRRRNHFPFANNVSDIVLTCVVVVLHKNEKKKKTGRKKKQGRYVRTNTPYAVGLSCRHRRNQIPQNGSIAKVSFSETTVKVLTPSALCWITLIRASSGNPLLESFFFFLSDVFTSTPKTHYRLTFSTSK